MTIQEAIEYLERVKAKHGPSVRLLKPSPNDRKELYTFEFLEARTGKTNEWRLVTRGGDPCVIVVD
jgi:hypothetical protein